MLGRAARPADARRRRVRVGSDLRTASRPDQLALSVLDRAGSVVRRRRARRRRRWYRSLIKVLVEGRASSRAPRSTSSRTADLNAKWTAKAHADGIEIF